MEVLPTHEEMMRRALFTPCETQEQLARWIRVFLNIDLPHCIVSDESNSSPMQALWEIYDKARKNDDAEFSRVMVFANRGGGKCVRKGTLLRGEFGLKPIEDVAVGEKIWSGWAWRRVTDWVHDGEKESRTLKLKNRLDLTTSSVHRVWTLTESGPDWVRVADLKPGDRVAFDTRRPIQHLVNRDEFDDGYVLGILAGDGCLAFLKSQGHVTLSTVDEYVLGKWKAFCLKMCGRFPRQSKSRPCDWRIQAKEIRSWLQSWGWAEDSHSFDKTLPKLTTYSQAAGFLSGLLDTDGFLMRNRTCLSLTSWPLIEGSTKLLHGLGIDAKVRRGKRLNGRQRHIVHHLWISAADSEKLASVGVKIKARKAGSLKNNARTNNPEKTIPRRLCLPVLERLPTKGGRWRETHGIKKPNVQYPRYSMDKLERLDTYRQALGLPSSRKWIAEVSRFDWVEVESVSVGVADFYDLTVEEDHSYWSEGLISHNTLSASILEVLQVLHLQRNVVHLAAIFDQSKKAQEYVRDFLNKPYLRDFRVGQNVKKIEVCRYFNAETGKSITEKEFLDLPETSRLAYQRIYNYMQIVLCTLQSTNGQHAEYCVLDEIDVIPKQNRQAYEEAKHIPDPRDGKLPITVLTSTRKFSYGLVQEELDKASKTGLHIRHWNAIDITEPCPPSRHLPEEPRVRLWVNEADVRHITEEDYLLLDEQARKRYYQREGFAGCVKCPLFSACKGRLATHQQSRSSMLKPISTLITQFRHTSQSGIQTQILCRKPDESGLIYPKLNREVHVKTAQQIAEMLTGEPQTRDITKAELLQMMVDKGARFYAGMDFGFSHNFAVVVGAVFGQFMFIVTVIAMPGLELDEKIAVCEPLRAFAPTIYGDPEAPADIKTFKRKGFHMREWDKYKGSVKAGIEVVRMKLQPAIGDPQLFFLADDPGVELLIQRLEKYHFMTDAAGQVSEEPDDDLDDECDALRYVVMNVFAPKGKLNLPNTKSSDVEDIRKTIAEATQSPEPGQPADWMRGKIASLTGNQEDSRPSEAKTVKRGRFIFDG